MNQIHEDLSVVLYRFPEYANAIKKHFHGNKEFQCMCEDYRRCCEALSYWTEVQTGEVSKPREDYATLLAELEAEIIEFLGEHP